MRRARGVGWPDDSKVISGISRAVDTATAIAGRE
jgi:hypothetical protein